MLPQDFSAVKLKMWRNSRGVIFDRADASRWPDLFDEPVGQSAEVAPAKLEQLGFIPPANGIVKILPVDVDVNDREE